MKIIILLLLFQSCYSNNNDTLPPLKSYYPTTNADTIVEHNYYTISYSFKNKNPEWTIYEYNNIDVY